MVKGRNEQRTAVDTENNGNDCRSRNEAKKMMGLRHIVRVADLLSCFSADN